jgi:carnitine O-acetyltransferase
MRVIISDNNTSGVPSVTPAIKWYVPNSVTETNKFQSGLPRLPIPELSSTIVKYLKSIRPLLNDDDFKRACVAAFESAVSDQGRELQERLIQRAKSKPDSSWLIDWWNDWCYLTDREPLVFFVSYFYAFKDLSPHVSNPNGVSIQSAVAAAIVQHSISFRNELLSGKLKPDKAGGRPQCMSQYAYIFNACRVPGSKTDHYVTYEPSSNNHVVVLCRGHIYSVNVIGSDGNSIGTAAMQAAFDAIVSDAKSLGDCVHPIGVLTSDLRDRWAQARELLIGSSASAETSLNSGSSWNRAGLEVVQSAILAVCLDEEEFSGAGDEGASERARAFWHGNGRNRFYVSELVLLP